MTTSAFGAGDYPSAPAAPVVTVTSVTTAPVAREYAGLITRGIGFVIDAAIVNAVAVVVAAAVALGLSVLPGSHHLRGLGIAIAGLVYVGWCIAYWATFWATTGQTPGDRVMHVKVIRTDGQRLHAVKAVVRVGATALAALPLLAGFVPIALTSRRRGLQDWIAGTVVVFADPPVTAAGAARAAHGSAASAR